MMAPSTAVSKSLQVSNRTKNLYLVSLRADGEIDQNLTVLSQDPDTKVSPIDELDLLLSWLLLKLQTQPKLDFITSI